VLARRVGVRHIELVEDAVQSALIAALTSWTRDGATPETFALLALMHLHLARLGARVDVTGGLLLLEEQDRSRWDRESIARGLAWLGRSAAGDTFSRFHAEAGIAAEHCLAPSYEQTRWQAISELYATLERIAPSPLHTLNKAVAIAEWQGPQAGLAVLDALAPPAWLSGSYLWDAVLGDLHHRAGHLELASQHRLRALENAPTDAVRELLRRRMAAQEGAPPTG
jgi:predicted RNA polymerase sigma factor